MEDFLLPFIIAFIAALIWLVVDTVKTDIAAEKQREMCVERRKEFVKSMGPGVRTIINDWANFLYIDDKRKVFGIDESGETIAFSELNSLSFGDESVTIFTGVPVNGNHFSYTFGEVRPLGRVELKRIADELMPIQRDNLYCELEKYHVTPTHEYEHEGNIMGCDINSKQFYVVYGCPAVYKFSELKQVTVEDVSKNSLCIANYIMHVTVKEEDDWMDCPTEYDFYFKVKDRTFFDLLAMFKGIRNRA